MDTAVSALNTVETSYQQITGRSYGPIETYHSEGADVVLLGLGATCETAKDEVDALREKGMKVGLVRVRLFRPFPAAELREALQGKKRIAVLDRAVSLGVGGILCQEIKHALFQAPEMPAVFPFITGLGGMDVTPEIINKIFVQTVETSTTPIKEIWVEE